MHRALILCAGLALLTLPPPTVEARPPARTVVPQLRRALRQARGLSGACVSSLKEVSRTVRGSAHALGSWIRRVFARKPPRSPLGLRLSPGELDQRIQNTVNERLGDSELTSTILGALGYLDDMQIRKRPGRGGAHYKSARDRGCSATFKAYLPGVKDPFHVPLLGVKGKNVEGEWASYIHAGNPLFGIKRGKTIFNVQDSSMFSTAYVVMPLFLFSDQALPVEQRFVVGAAGPVWECVEDPRRTDEPIELWLEVQAPAGTTLVIPTPRALFLLETRTAGVLTGQGRVLRVVEVAR